MPQRQFVQSCRFSSPTIRSVILPSCVFRRRCSAANPHQNILRATSLVFWHAVIYSCQRRDRPCTPSVRSELYTCRSGSCRHITSAVSCLFQAKRRPVVETLQTTTRCRQPATTAAVPLIAGKSRQIRNDRVNTRGQQYEHVNDCANTV